MISKEYRKEIGIGIPCFGDVDPLILQDYMKWFYYLGRRCQDYDFALAIRSKTEQFRARNAIIEEFLVRGSDYILMLDDDQVIDIDRTVEEQSAGPCMNYGFPALLAERLDERPEIGAIGGLYLQRRDLCAPVLLNESRIVKGTYSPLLYLEISGKMQKVDVVGGGCIMFPKKVFDKIGSPWFEAESTAGYSTDIQICKKVKEVGFEVWADTGIHLGHQQRDRKVVTMKTAANLIDTQRKGGP